jgi:hypothetical protein
MPTVAGPEVVRARRPLAFGAADTGYDRAEHLIEFSGRTHSPGPWLRRVPRDGTADLRQTVHGSAEFDLSEQTKVLVGDPIQMFLRRQPLVLACLEKDVAEFPGRRPALLGRFIRIFRVAVSCIPA